MARAGLEVEAAAGSVKIDKWLDLLFRCTDENQIELFSRACQMMRFETKGCISVFEDLL